MKWLPGKYLPWIAIGYLCLHALAILANPHDAMAASYPFEVLAPWLAFAACCWRALASPPQTRLLWRMVCVGLLLWAYGISLAAWEDLTEHFTSTIAYFSDFIYFIYGVPILLAISVPTDGDRVPLFLWLDGVQAAMTAYLVYVTLFHTLPFTNRVSAPITAALLTRTFNIENLMLAGAATVRLIAQPRNGEERRFYQILSGFLWVYAVCAGLYNSQVLATQAQTGLSDLLVVVPFLLMTLAVLQQPQPAPELSVAAQRNSLSLFLDSASPVLFTLGLLALGFANVAHRYRLGVLAIVVAVAVYAVRAATLQTRYLRSQRDLREARDRLEELSLQDGLTGVANRRRFDQMLETEWSRASRLQHPLSLLMIDVDFFKNLNDRYGHRAGDQCLIAIAQALQESLPRSSDLLARYGGEEFAIILAATDRDGAEVVAERMLTSVRGLSIPNETEAGSFVGISIGIATWEYPQVGSAAAILEASDRALYRAKQNGRDRIAYFSLQAVLDTASPDLGSVQI